jgi:hypothetical protein
MRLVNEILHRRRATDEFSPAFQGRGRGPQHLSVAFATVETPFQLSLTRRQKGQPRSRQLARVRKTRITVQAARSYIDNRLSKL